MTDIRPNQPPPTEEVSCIGKQRYDSMDLAHRVNKKRRVRGRFEPYRCVYCGGYHIGRSETQLILKEKNQKNWRKKMRIKNKKRFKL